MPNRDLPDMRKNYTLRKLKRSDLHVDPVEQFKLWFDQAIHSDVHEPNAMALATVNSDIQPSCRIVLLKGIDQGFIFYTNYSSRKGQQIEQHSQAAATFWWDKLERQVRIEGRVEKVDPGMSDNYFSSRPPGSQLSAACSPQSQVIPSYQYLRELRDALDTTAVKRPDNWGGYRIKPTRIEFWQGRENRLHDRFVYQWDIESSNWALVRLAP